MDIGAGLSMWLDDLDGLRRAARELDQAGFDFLTVGGHLLTAAAGRYPERPDFTYAVPFRDPFLLFAHLAASTERVKFRTSVVIAPMLPTALIAKQAADVSLLSDGRFQLGVGISWQDAEYRALGHSLKSRGARLDEQMTVLRLLWSQPLVSFTGAFHDISELGLGQLPHSPIPIWIGSSAQETPLRRAATRADGWMPSGPLPGPEPVGLLREYADAAGRELATPVTGVVLVGHGDVVESALQQISFGATEVLLAPPFGESVIDALPKLIKARQQILAATAS